jgi:hypothetical protein
MKMKINKIVCAVSFAVATMYSAHSVDMLVAGAQRYPAQQAHMQPAPMIPNIDIEFIDRTFNEVVNLAADNEVIRDVMWLGGTAPSFHIYDNPIHLVSAISTDRNCEAATRVGNVLGVNEPYGRFYFSVQTYNIGNHQGRQLFRPHLAYSPNNADWNLGGHQIPYNIMIIGEHGAQRIDNICGFCTHGGSISPNRADCFPNDNQWRVICYSVNAPHNLGGRVCGVTVMVPDNVDHEDLTYMPNNLFSRLVYLLGM